MRGRRTYNINFVPILVALEQSHILDPKPESSDYSTPMPKIQNLPLNIPLDTNFTETQKERLLLYQVYWQFCFGVVIFNSN